MSIEAKVKFFYKVHIQYAYKLVCVLRFVQFAMYNMLCAISYVQFALWGLFCNLIDKTISNFALLSCFVKFALFHLLFGICLEWFALHNLVFEICFLNIYFLEFYLTSITLITLQLSRWSWNFEMYYTHTCRQVGVLNWCCH